MPKNKYVSRIFFSCFIFLYIYFHFSLIGHLTCLVTLMSCDTTKQSVLDDNICVPHHRLGVSTFAKELPFATRVMHCSSNELSTR